MKRSLFIVIVVLLMAALFVSCNADKATEDQLFEVTIDGGSKTIEASATLDVDIEQLYWFYKAEKIGGIFTQGQQLTEVPIKKDTTDAPVKGLANSSLGQMSKGIWRFSFYGYNAVSTTGAPVGNPVYKQESLEVRVEANISLEVTLERGDGELPAPQITFAADGLTWMLSGVAQDLALSLEITDNDAAFIAGIQGVYNTEKGKYVFAITDTKTVTAEKHTLKVTVINSYTYNQEIFSEIVGEATIIIDAKAGMKYVISDVSGIDVLDVPVDVEIGTPTKPLEATTTIATSTAAITKTVNVSPAGVATDATTIEFAAGSFEGDEGNLELGVVTYSAEAASAKFSVASSDAIVGGIDLTLTQGTTAVTTFSDDFFVTVTTFIGINLQDVKVLYNGSEYINGGTSGEKYYEDYVPSTGLLTFKTNHFSEFVVLATGCSRIGDKYYGTLDAAFAALQEGDTLTIAQDIDFSTPAYASYFWAGSTYNPMEITKSNVTIDLAGHTFSNMGNVAICIGNDLAAEARIENVTIKNGTLLAGQTSGVTNSYVLGISNIDGAKIEDITTLGGINVYTGSENVVIEDCTIVGTKYYAVCAQCGSHAIIKDSTLTKNTDSSVATKAMFWIDAAGSDGDMITPENPTGAYGASSITLESGSYTVDTANGGIFYLSSGLKPIVKGGTYNIDPSACVAEGLVASEVNGLWTVGLPVATIGSDSYGSLQAAFDAAVDGDTITVESDIELSFSSEYALTVGAGKSVTLDLNGKTISGTATRSAVSYLLSIPQGSSLTIVDSGSTGCITYKSTAPSTSYSYGTYTICNYGTLTLEAGTIDNTTNGGASYAIENHNNYVNSDITFIMNGGVVKCDNGDQAIRVYANNGNTQLTGRSVMVMNGGTVESGGIWCDMPGKGTIGLSLTINGGTVNGMLDFISKGDKSEIKILGGTFDCPTLRIRANTDQTKDYIEIAGGNWTIGTIDNSNASTDNTMAISGGTFSIDPSAYLAEGYSATQDGNAWIITQSGSVQTP